MDAESQTDEGAQDSGSRENVGNGMVDVGYAGKNNRIVIEVTGNFSRILDDGHFGFTGLDQRFLELLPRQPHRVHRHAVVSFEPLRKTCSKSLDVVRFLRPFACVVGLWARQSLDQMLEASTQSPCLEGVRYGREQEDKNDGCAPSLRERTVQNVRGYGFDPVGDVRDEPENDSG